MISEEVKELQARKKMWDAITSLVETVEELIRKMIKEEEAKNASLRR